MELTDLTITKVHEGLKKKEFSALELCRAYLDNIKKRNKEIFAFLTVTENLAVSQAKLIDEKIAEGETSNLGDTSTLLDPSIVEEIKNGAADL